MIRQEQCNKVCRILDDVLANRPTERDLLIVAVQKAFDVLEKQRWIPVSERLPDDLAEVNVTWVNHKPEPYYDFVKDKPCTGSAVYYKGDWYWYSSVCADLLAEYGKNEIDEIDDAIEITAWMPLPEPYQGVER
jgi:hypothetical protein